MNNLVENLPAVTEAALPVAVNYEAARTAIAKCEKIDDCATWANKSAAMASYARQANDDGLRVMAVRIQSRAMRRMGELSKATPSRNNRGPDDELLGARKFEVLEAAGVSRNQAYQAEAIADIPQADFDAKVDSAKPPTVTQLAQAGSKKRQRSEDAEAREIAKATDAIRAFAKFCEQNDPRCLLTALSSRARADLQGCFYAIEQWMDWFADAHNAPVEGSDDAVMREP